MRPQQGDDPYPCIDTLLGVAANCPGTPDADRAWRQTLATGLFTSAGEGRFQPVHRRVAEYLGGRYLAKLIDDGLPASRLLALMTSDVDGGIVTPLRGLAAWLATHCTQARVRIIKADPVGTGLYGDVSEFDRDEKKYLIESLHDFATRGPLFGHQFRDDPDSGLRDDTAWAFRALASAPMKDTLADFLKDKGEETEDIRMFLLEVLAQADTSNQPGLAGLAPVLSDILETRDISPDMRRWTVDAYLHLVADPDRDHGLLFKLLEDIIAGTTEDPFDDTYGRLLTALYPSHISDSNIWKYIEYRNNESFRGSYQQFWWDYFVPHVEIASLPDVLELLNALDQEQVQRIHDNGSFFANRHVFLAPLSRYLELVGDSLDVNSLTTWLTSTANHSISRQESRQQDRIREWLQEHPDTQKAIYLAWIRNGIESKNLHDHALGVLPMRFEWSNVLHGSKLPPDFGLWCAESAIEFSNSEPALASVLLNHAAIALERPGISEELDHDVALSLMEDHPELKQQWQAFLQAKGGAEGDHIWKDREQRVAEYNREQQEKRTRRMESLREHEDHLRNNSLPAHILHQLATVYHGIAAGTDSNLNPRDRLQEFLGYDEELIDQVEDALRQAVFREGIPGIGEITSVFLEGRMPFLAFPVLASLDLLDQDSDQRLDSLSELQIQQAITMFLYFPLGYESMPSWYTRWSKEHPKLVLSTIETCASDVLRARRDFLPGLNELDSDDLPQDAVHGLRLKLLKVFEDDAPQWQMPILDRILTSAFLYRNRSLLLDVVEDKLQTKRMYDVQRVRWLTMEHLLSGSAGQSKLIDFVNGNSKRIQHLAELLTYGSRSGLSRWKPLTRHADPDAISPLIKVLGSYYPPASWVGDKTFSVVTLAMETSDVIARMIRQLGSSPVPCAALLTELTENPELKEWRECLVRAQEEQRRLHRDAVYRHPSVEEVVNTLSNGAPANAGDLAALLKDRLDEIGLHIRGDSSNLWSPFWNQDSNEKPSEPKPENACRDALLPMLQNSLPSGVHCRPEARYAGNTRADIEVSCGKISIPIEIKRAFKEDLWTAARDQLVNQYTTDPASSGYGVYLVLWFGDHPKPVKTSPDGVRYATPGELQAALSEHVRAELDAGQADKIKVAVLDVTKPGDHRTRT